MSARKLGFGLVTMAALAVPAAATPLPRHGIFVYSSLCTSAQSGDAEGNRLMLIRDGDGDRALWEWSDGPLEGPVAVTKLRIQDGTIAFDADIGSQDGTTSDGKFEKDAPSIVHYQGAITASEVRVGAGRHQEIWPRVTNFAAKTGICR